MTKLKKTLKWSAIILIPISVIYTLVWVAIGMSLSNILNKEYAGKNIEISDTATVKFASANSSGFPFCLNIELHGFVEENNNTMVTHSSPLVIGYNVITQTLSSYYKGESIARYKPVESGFGVKVTGEYQIHAYVPLNSTFFRILILKHQPFEIINYINDLNIISTNTDIIDLEDKSIIIDDANLHVKLSVKHHTYYHSMEELLEAIPQDYSIKVTANTKNSGEITHIIPFSIVYLAYLPFNFQYDFDADIHTDSKEFEIKDILSNIKVQTNKMTYNSNLQKVTSALNLSNINADEIHEFDVDYSSEIRLLDGFTKYIVDSIKSWSHATIADDSTKILKQLIGGFDFSTINFDTKEKPIKFHLNATLKKEENHKFDGGIENLSVYFENTGFDLKARIIKSDEEESLKGVMSIVEWRKLIHYLATSYEAIRNLPDYEIYTDAFWGDFYVDFLESIANSMNNETSTLTINFDITRDILKSEIGKYSWPEVRLLYYAKLFEHTLAVCKDREEALTRFRMVIPQEINDPKILEKVIQPR